MDTNREETNFYIWDSMIATLTWENVIEINRRFIRIHGYLEVCIFDREDGFHNQLERQLNHCVRDSRRSCKCVILKYNHSPKLCEEINSHVPQTAKLSHCLLNVLYIGANFCINIKHNWNILSMTKMTLKE